MNTENLNMAPENGAQENKSACKSAKTKKMAGKAAQFAAAAGVGVAGTMAANASRNPEEEIVEGATASTVHEQPESEETVAIEEPVEFEANDIMIEEIEEGEIEASVETLSDDEIHEIAMEAGIEPITGMETVDIDANVAMIDVDDTPVSDHLDMNGYDELGSDSSCGSCDLVDNDSLIADAGMAEPDILDDILNA